MPRIVPPVVALVLFLGLGFLTRHYFPIWLEGKLKESQEAMDKEKQNWKPVKTNFDNVTFDRPIIRRPTFDSSQFNQPAVNPPRQPKPGRVKPPDRR